MESSWTLSKHNENTCGVHALLWWVWSHLVVDIWASSSFWRWWFQPEGSLKRFGPGRLIQTSLLSCSQWIVSKRTRTRFSNHFKMPVSLKISKLSCSMPVDVLMPLSLWWSWLWWLSHRQQGPCEFHINKNFMSEYDCTRTNVFKN